MLLCQKGKKYMLLDLKSQPVVQCVPEKSTPLEMTLLLLNMHYYASGNLN